MTLITRIIPIILLTLLSVYPATAQDSLNVRLVAGESYWESIYHVAVSGHYAYVAAGLSGLKMLDVTNPQTPIEIGHCDLPSYSRKVIVRGDYAYVSSTQGGLLILSLADPRKPRLVGSYTIDDAADLVISGKYAYLTGFRTGLWILNISDPRFPTRAGFLKIAGTAGQVAVHGNFAYVTTETMGLRVINVFNASEPKEVAFYDNHNHSFCLALNGEYAYIGEDQTLRVINITDPLLPTDVGNVPTPDYIHFIEINGDNAYLGEGVGLQIMDLSRPREPLEVGFYKANEPLVSMALQDNRAYLAAEHSSVRILDMTRPTAPVEIGAYGHCGSAISVAASGNIICKMAVDGTLTLYQITDRGEVKQCSELKLSANGQMVIKQGYLYVVTYQDLYVINIAAPAAPSIEGHFQGFYNASDLDVSGNNAFVTERSKGLLILDISDLDRFRQIGECSLEPPVYYVVVQGQYAYVANGKWGLQVIDISSPSAPLKVGRLESQSEYEQVAVSGKYAYLYEDGRDELVVVRIGNPLHPEIVGRVRVGQSQGLAVALNQRVYVAGVKAGLEVVNVADPANPEIVGYYRTPGYGFSVGACGKYACLASQTFFGVFDCSATATAQVVGDAGGALKLWPCMPNPFNASTVIGFTLLRNARVAVTIADSTGHSIAQLLDAQCLAGKHTVAWSPRNQPAGRYLVRATVGKKSAEREVFYTK